MLDKAPSLAEYALQPPKTISFAIEQQFPAIYREVGRELIDLVKEYYRFLERLDNQSTYNIRRMYEYRNIDTTLESMLIFFKNKFLNGLFFDDNITFVIKNILDLYRRKGSKEGIELFFQLFFQSEVGVYFPSEDIFKPSDSIWKVGTYLQLYPLGTSILPDLRGVRIFGSISNAEAFIDTVYFVNIGQTFVPIIFISNLRGDFTRFDVIYSREPDFVIGTLYGSLRSIVLDSNIDFTGGNQIGDIVEIQSETGFNALGRVSEVTQNFSGEIVFTVIDGGFGYTVSNTDIITSDQILFVDDLNNITINEKLTQLTSSNTVSEGTVIGFDSRNKSIGIALDDINSPFEEGAATILDRVSDNTIDIIFTSEVNNTASADVGTITNTEEVTIITDLISDFLNVPIDSSNYSFIPPAIIPMSGTVATGVEPNLNTPLNEAFDPTLYVMGSIETLSNINPGADYTSNIFVLARENLFSRFNLGNKILRIVSSVGVNILEGDFLTQERTIKTFEGDDVQTIVKGKVVAVEGNNITIQQMSFQSFVVSRDILTQILVAPVFKQGLDIPLEITNISSSASLPLGLNANIDSILGLSIGKIKAIDVFSSGIGYENQAPISISNITKAERLQQDPIIDATGIGITQRSGITEGKWITETSNINTSKVIQDSFFYQDYSYELSTDISPDLYEEIYRSVAHLSGMKLFTKFDKIDFISLDVDIDLILTKYRFEDSLIEENGTVFAAENGFLYLNTQIVED